MDTQLTDLTYALLIFLAVSIIINIFQYRVVCAMQNALDEAAYYKQELRKLETPIQSIYQD